MVHPSHGGCTIREVCTREIRGETGNYYVLVPESEPNTTILTPVGNTTRIGLKGIISSQQADEILDYAATIPPEWIKDNAKRKNRYAEILKDGSLTAIAGMIKDLTVQGSHVSLNQSDRILLQNAQKRLLSVIALAKEIDLDQAGSLMTQAVHPSAS